MMKLLIKRFTSVAIVIVLALLMTSVSCITVNVTPDEEPREPSQIEDQDPATQSPANQPTTNEQANTAPPTVEIPSIANPPVIHSFIANPEAVSVGNSSSVLSWSVSNATSIEITPDIGKIDAAGNVTVNPGETTSYTLTASNTIDSRSQTITVTVTSLNLPPVVIQPSPGLVSPLPDLVVENAYFRIGHPYFELWIRNQGAAKSPESKVAFSWEENGALKWRVEPVPSLEPGYAVQKFIRFELKSEMLGEIFTYTVDPDNTVVESNEANNTLEKKCQYKSPDPYK